MAESAVGSGCPVSEMIPAEGKRGAQIQAVLFDETGNEILTWAETGSPGAQPC